MALNQDVTPINPALMDAMVRAGEGDWIPMDDAGKAFVKVLWTGPESGGWAAMYRWYKGFVAPQHKHLSASHTFILSGKLQVRDGVLNAGDYIYEPNGMLHGATTALEDTDYLFICNGPVVFYTEKGLSAYLGWEELLRMQSAHQAKQAAAKAA